MLFSAIAFEGKIIIISLFAAAGLTALVIYLPTALIQEVTRSENEVLPEWMGTVRERRNRLRIIIAVLGGLAIGLLIIVMLGGE